MGNADNARAIFHPPQSAVASLTTGAYAPASASLSTIAQQAQKYTGATGAAIALKEGQIMVCHAAAGTTAPDVGVALRLEGSFAGLCVQSGQIMQCQDAENDPRVDAGAARSLGVRSMLIIPIHQQNAVAGILAVYSPVAHAFKERHAVILKTMAEVIAEILANQVPDEPPAAVPAPPAPAGQVASDAEKLPTVATASVPVPAFRKPAPVVAPPAPSVPSVTVPIEREKEPGAVAEPPRSSLGPVPLAEALDRPAQPDSPAAPLHVARPAPVHPQPPEFNVPIFATSRPESRWKRILPVAAVAILAVAIGGYWMFRGQPRAEARKPTPDLAPIALPAPAPETVAETSTPPASAPAAREPRPASDPVPSPKKEPVEAVIFAAPKEPLPNAIRLAPDMPASGLGSRPAPAQSSRDVAADEPPSVVLPQSSGLVSVPEAPKTMPVLAQPPRSSHVTPSQVMRRVPPVYPEIARRSGIQGTVVLTATVTKTGRLRDVRIVRGNPVFNNSALTAVQQWLYKPGYLNGEPIETTTEIVLTFALPK